MCIVGAQQEQNPEWTNLNWKSTPNTAHAMSLFLQGIY